MNQSILLINGPDITLGTATAAFGVAVLALLVTIVVITVRAFRRRAQEVALQVRQSEATQHRIAELARIQAETAGRLQALGEGLGGRQAELARVMTERLDAVSARLGQSMDEATRQTVQRLQCLHERIAVIDHAQKNLADLSGQVTSLRDVLGNKQARGAFGQARMETIVADGLPKGLFAFQHTLSNNTRPDCVIFLPDQPALIIDAKFPLEAIMAFRDSKTEEGRQRAAQRLRQDVWRHISDIAGKYLLPGETQEMALMFVPSESVYAELYEGFDDLVQKAYRARVVMVSPSLLMLAIQVMQQILKDARMREAAHLIHAEVGRMMGDVGRLQERVLKLQQHYGQASEDMRQILISTEKIGARAGRIDQLDFGDSATGEGNAAVMLAPASLKLEAGE
ncbi:MAG TPA: DNA recombination protein RmuC [Xanthobacteraceae bacterium]|nr:DNA recombination protein RmuC [Xanthobacteraceae bacterium]